MIHLIHGADSFRAREKLNELIGEFGKKGQNAANLDIFDIGEENAANKIKAAAQILGFLSPARMIVVKSLFSEGRTETKKDIADFVLALSEKKSAPDFIFFETKEIGKKGGEAHLRKTTGGLRHAVASLRRSEGGKEWATLAKRGEVFCLSPLSSAELRKWALSRFATLKTKLAPGALEKLLLYAGDDLWRLSGEIEKLSLLKSGSGEPVTGDDVESMVKGDFSTSIFATMDALAGRDKKTALKLLAGHLEKGEAPIYLFSMFAYQISNLIKVKNALVRESVSGKSANPDEISQTLKMHPFVVKKTIPYAAKFSLDYLKKIHKRLLRFDFLIKKGRLDAEAALEMIVIEFSNLI